VCTGWENVLGVLENGLQSKYFGAMCTIECMSICVLCAVLLYWVEWVMGNLGGVWMSCDIKTVFAGKRYCPMLIREGGNAVLQQLHDSADVNRRVRDICRNILDILATKRWKWGLLYEQISRLLPQMYI
jgi:hypothetical protein